MRSTAAIAASVFGFGLLTACGGRAPGPHPETPAAGRAPAADGTSATTTVTPDEHEFVESVQQMLQGKVAGLQVVDLPGCGITLRIRGMTDSLTSWDAGSNSSVSQCEREPLLMIDGTPVPLGNMELALRTLLPRDIERIQVLKDVASTSMYGTRGANGVVLITTRH